VFTHQPFYPTLITNSNKKNLQNLEILIPLPEVTVNNNPRKEKEQSGRPASQPACTIAFY
jgi:hypothetical protein